MKTISLELSDETAADLERVAEEVEKGAEETLVYLLELGQEVHVRRHKNRHIRAIAVVPKFCRSADSGGIPIPTSDEGVKIASEIAD